MHNNFQSSHLNFMIASKTEETKEEHEQQIVFLKKQHERDQQHLQELGEEQRKRDQRYDDLAKTFDDLVERFDKLTDLCDELLEDQQKQVEVIDQKDKKIGELKNSNEMLRNVVHNIAESYAATAPALNKILRGQVMGHQNHHKFVPPQQIQPELQKSPADEWVGQKMRFHPNGSIYQVASAHYRDDFDSGFTMAEETMRVGEEEGGDHGNDDGDREEDGREWTEVERALLAPLLDDVREWEEEDDGVFEEAEGEGEVAVAAAPAPEGEGNDGDGGEKEEETNSGEQREDGEKEEEEVVNPIPSKFAAVANTDSGSNFCCSPCSCSAPSLCRMRSVWPAMSLCRTTTAPTAIIVAPHPSTFHGSTSNSPK